MIVTPNWVCVLQKTSTKVWSWRPLVMRTSFIFNYSISSFPATFLLILASDIPNTKNETRNLINLFHCQYWIGFYLQNQLTYHTRTTSEWRYLECNVRSGDQLPFVWSTDRFKKKVKNSMYNLTDNKVSVERCSHTYHHMTVRICFTTYLCWFKMWHWKVHSCQQGKVPRRPVMKSCVPISNVGITQKRP